MKKNDITKIFIGILSIILIIGALSACNSKEELPLPNDTPKNVATSSGAQEPESTEDILEDLSEESLKSMTLDDLADYYNTVYFTEEDHMKVKFMAEEILLGIDATELNESVEAIIAESDDYKTEFGVESEEELLTRTLNNFYYSSLNEFAEFNKAMSTMAGVIDPAYKDAPMLILIGINDEIKYSATVNYKDVLESE